MADADVVVAGAGPAGLMTALSLARAGQRVLLIEKRSAENFGKAIRVSVEERIFSETGLALPPAPIRLPSPSYREFIAPDNKHRFTLRHLPLVRLDLQAFLRKMLAVAEAAGVRFLFETTVTGPRLTEGRVAGVVGESADGRLLEVTAALTVDASGIAGALRHELPEEFGLEREISIHDVCNAWQDSRELDRPAVMELLSRNRIRPQVDVVRLGFMGPFSMFSVLVDLDDDRVEATCGLLHDPRFPEARDLVARYMESHHWIGEPIAKSGGLIPIRRPLDSMVADGLVCAGDSACQAIPQHASGVASALLAGKILAEVAQKALEQNDVSTAALWPYNARYMEARGIAQANSDLFRRFIISLSTDELSALFACGLITEEGIHGSLEGLPLELPRSAVFAAAMKFLSRPGLLLRMARLSRDVKKAFKLYSAYPKEYDPLRFERWRREAGKLFDRWRPQPVEPSPGPSPATEETADPVQIEPPEE